MWDRQKFLKKYFYLNWKYLYVWLVLVFFFKYSYKEYPWCSKKNILKKVVV